MSTSHHSIEFVSNQNNLPLLYAFVAYLNFDFILPKLYRTFKDLKEYVVSMKGEKDSGSDDGKAEIPKVSLLDAKNFEESVKTGNLYS